MSTRGLRHDAFQSLAALMRPLNDALKDLGTSLDAKRAEGRRVFSEVRLILNVGGTTLPVRISPPTNGTVKALYLAKVMPADSAELPTGLGVPYWTLDPDGKVALRACPGLSNGKTYTLRFEWVMEGI